MVSTSAKKPFNCFPLIYTVKYFYVFPVTCYIKHVRCKIHTVPEEGWFGQPKYSTPPYKTFYVVSVSASIFFITRSLQLPHIPVTAFSQTDLSISIRNFSIRFQGPKFFNSLSPKIQNSESIRLFGKRLKKFLLS